MPLIKFVWRSALLLTLSIAMTSCGSDNSGPGNKPAPVKFSDNLVNADLPVFPTTEDGLEQLVNSSLKNANNSLDKIANLKGSELSFENTFLALDNTFDQFERNDSINYLLQSASTSKVLRDKSKALNQKYNSWYVDASLRKDVFDKLMAFTKKGVLLSGQDQKLVVDTINGYKKSGLSLEDEKLKEELKGLKKKLSELSTKFSANVRAFGSKNSTHFAKEEMEGMPKSVLESELAPAAKEDGSFDVSPTIYSQISSVYKYSPKEEVRKKATLARSTVAKDINLPVMQEILKTRMRISEILGYKNWADYQTEDRMAKTGDNAVEFLSNLNSGLQPKFDQEIEVLRLLKVKATGEANAVIKYWDVSYYENILKKEKYDLDLNALKDFFTLDKTLKGMLSVFEKVFSLKIDFIENFAKFADDELQLISVSDAKSKEVLGYLYLDLYPRPKEEKYGHFAHFGLISGKQYQDGSFRKPVGALICNFPRPVGDKPSLLSFGQVETLFHEFGHGLHNMLSRAKYPSMAGTNVARDFVEAPSQMLEYFVMDKQVLDTFAVNYKDGVTKIDPNFLKKIEEVEKATVATGYKVQFSYGLLDLKLHTQLKEEDLPDLVAYSNKILGDVHLPHAEGASFLTNFGHIAGGYSAGYYGYAWSDSIAADMASKFSESEKGFLDPEIGLKLRQEIYSQGSSRDITKSVELFLDRPISNVSFLKKLGL
ncbi:MAG: Zn-dependent oligopeptidase [Bacteriovoracaceae bacterium]|nr:Zn-dependent oligopeptidase [Bacteriovoracaceae bacterium]